MVQEEKVTRVFGRTHGEGGGKRFRVGGGVGLPSRQRNQSGGSGRLQGSHVRMRGGVSGDGSKGGAPSKKNRSESLEIRFGKLWKGKGKSD